MEVWIRNAYFVSGGISPYNFLPPVSGLSFAFLNRSIGSVGYLPLWSLTLAALFRFYSIVAGGNRFVLYFLVKQPGVLGDVCLGYMLYQTVLKCGGTRYAALAAMRFWVFFPFGIVVSAVWGQFDALVVASFFYFQLAERPVRRCASLAVGIFLKLVPVLFVPYLALRNRSTDCKTQMAALALPATLTLLIFSLANWDFGPFTGTLTSQVLGRVVIGMNYMNLFGTPFTYPFFSRIGYFYVVIHLLWIPGVAVASLVALRLFPSSSMQHSTQALLLILVAFFLTRWGVNEQLMIYLFPLMLVDVLVWHPERRLLFEFTWILGIIFLAVRSDLFLVFAGPVFPGAMDLAFRLQDINNPTIFVSLYYAAIYLLGTLFSIFLVQIALVLIHPSRDSTPWLLRPVVRRKAPLSILSSDGEGDP